MSNNMIYTGFLSLLFLPIHAQSLQTNVNEPIVVEGQLFEQSGLIDGPVKVEAMDEGYIKEQQYQDLAQAIGDIPGVSVQETQRRAGAKSALIQGFGENSVLVMIDGTPVSQNSSFGFDLSQIGSADIQKVEVIKGGASSLYGSQAMGGVINIVTKKPQSKTKWMLEASRAQLEQGGTGHNIQINGSGKSLGLGYKVSFTHRDQDDLDLDEDTLKKDDVAFSKSQASVYVDKEWGRGRTYAQYILLRGKTLSTTSRPYSSSSFGVALNNTESLNHNIRVGHERKLDNGLLKVIANTEITEDELSLNDNPDTAFIETFKDTRFKARRAEVIVRDLKWGPQTMTIGLLAKEDEVTQETTTQAVEQIVVKTTDIADKKIGSFEGYFQDNIFIGSFEISPGVRYQNDRDFGAYVSPKMSLSHYADFQNTSLKSWLTVGTGYRTPSVKERFFTLDHTSVANYIVEGNNDLVPEESTSIQLGQELRVDDDHRLYVNLFLNQISNLIDTTERETNTTTRLFTYENVSQALSRGIEIGFDSRLSSGLLGKLNFSYTETINEETDLLLANRPLYMAMASLQYNLNQKANLILLNRYSGRQYLDQENTQVSPDFFTTDLKINYQWSRDLSVIGSLNNIFDSTRSAGQDVVVPVQDLRPARGREVFIGLRATL